MRSTDPSTRTVSPIAGVPTHCSERCLLAKSRCWDLRDDRYLSSDRGFLQSIQRCPDSFRFRTSAIETDAAGLLPAPKFSVVFLERGYKPGWQQPYSCPPEELCS